MANEPPRHNRTNGLRNGPGNTNANVHGPYAGYLGGGQNASEQVRDILHVLFKRKRFIAAVFLAITLPGLIATLVRKPRYVASAKVMISKERTDPTVQPTELTRLETIQLNESLVNSEVHVITSRDLLEHVVRALALSGDGGGPSRLLSRRRPFGKQVLTMARSLSVTPIKASNVIQVSYRAADPARAARIVNRVVDEYLAYHATVHGTKGLPRFYDEQQRILGRKLRRAEDALAAFATEHGIVAPQDEIEATLHTVSKVQGSLRDVTTSIVGAEERIRAIRDQIASQPEVVKQSQFLDVNPVITQLATQIVDRQVDRVALRRKYTDKDRHVRDNEEEIAALEQQIKDEKRENPTIVTHQIFRSNPLREDRLRTLLELESSLRELRARQATLEEEESRANRRLVSLQRQRVEYDRLNQQVRNNRDTYELYIKRAQEARISQAMDEQKLVNVDVVERPALPLPRADRRRISVVVLIIAGLVVGIAGAFGREYMSRSLRSEYDVGRHLGLPLLASIGDASRA
ncbi:MAG: GumC family protein [Candidatus Binatia bacterium]